MPPRLSVVIPAYNEEAAIRAGKLDQVRAWLKAQPYDSELIVVDDQSQDATASMAETFADRVVRIQHAGKAAAVIAGIRASQGTFVLFSDMDQATPIEEASRLVEALQSGCQIAIGSRGLKRVGAPAWRYLLSWGQMLLKWLLLGLRFTDTQCGFKAFTNAAARAVLPHLVVYAPERLGTVNGPSVTSGFDVEFLFVAQRLGMSVCEVNVQWNYQRTRRVHMARDTARGLRDLFSILSNRLHGKYPRRKSNL